MANKKKDSIRDFKITSVTIKEGCNPKIMKTLSVGTYHFYGPGLADDFFLHHVNVSAIVGMNGAGKSSLLELIFRMVNNFSAYLVGNSIKREGATELYIIPEIHAELRYQMGGKEGVLYNEGEIVALAFGEKKYLLTEQNANEGDRFGDFERCYKPTAAKRSEIAKCFFYTVVTNYALQAYNSVDYQDEEANEFDRKGQVGYNTEGNWLDSLFHKNDGYATPIVLTPYRNKGVIDMNTETQLTKDRLVGILTEAKKKNRTFIDGYRLCRVQFTFDPFRVTRKLPGKYGKEDVQTCESRFRSMYEEHNSVVKLVLENYTVELNQVSTNYVFGCIYLVYKTLAVSSKYPSYADYASLGNLDMMNDMVDDEEDRELLFKLIDDIKQDKSHITTKIRQTLHFLKNFSNKELERDDFDYTYYESWLGKEKEDTSLEATLELMPPPIFESKVFLGKVLGKNEIQEEIPFYKLSSGERQFLFLMSSIVYHIMNLKSVPTSRMAYRCMNIVLDEVEICFHPEYQRTFIYKLLKIIKDLHLNTYCSFNILLTTHSPFLLSDIPQSNVLYLEEGKVKDKTNMQNPFAANVNDILYQSFFLENGFMGEFVKQKIIRMIKNVKRHKANRQEAMTWVELIGEPLLCERMKALLWEEEQ